MEYLPSFWIAITHSVWLCRSQRCRFKPPLSCILPWRSILVNVIPLSSVFYMHLDAIQAFFLMWIHIRKGSKGGKFHRFPQCYHATQYTSNHDWQGSWPWLFVCRSPQDAKTTGCRVIFLQKLWNICTFCFHHLLWSRWMSGCSTQRHILCASYHEYMNLLAWRRKFQRKS